MASQADRPDTADSLSANAERRSARAVALASRSAGTSWLQPWSWTHRLGIVLATLTHIAFETAAADGQLSPLALGGRFLLGVVFLLVAGQCAQWWQRRGHSQPAWLLWVTLAAGAAPIVWDPISRAWLDTGDALEITMVSGLRNIILVLAAASAWPASARFSCAAGTFLMVFIAALSDLPAVQICVFLYAIVGIWWLMGTYWDTLRTHLPAQSERQFPVRWWLVLPLALAPVLLMFPKQTSQLLTSTAGWFGSSGGTGRSDPFSRGGVNDGESLVAGTDNIQSFAPIDDAPFLSSDQPSLWDLFDDRYDEPAKPVNTDKAVSLPKQLSAEVEKRMAQNKDAGRQFATLRKRRDTAAREVGDRESTALLFVSGRTPLHLKLDQFDLYDGFHWYPEVNDQGKWPLIIRERNQRPWLEIEQGHSQDFLFRGTETHALKILNLKSATIPAPPNLLRVHIDQVDRTDLYRWEPNGMLAMDRQSIPDLTVLHVHSGVLNPQQLKLDDARLAFGSGSFRYRALPDLYASRSVSDLARLWTRDVPAGWPQVETIVHRLRNEYQLDSSVQPPSECLHTVAHFLYCDRKGSDYLFASSAAMMLRSLGFSTRLCSGLYVDPRKYDARKRQTRVDASDLHFWPEVYVGVGTWVAIEPTPGYEILRPVPTVLEGAWAILVAMAVWCLKTWWLLVSVTALIAALIWFRHELYDSWRQLRWAVSLRNDPRRSVLTALSVLEQRAAASGWARRPGMTRRRWLEGLGRQLPSPQQGLLADLSPLADWAEFAPADHSVGLGDWSRVLDDVVRQVTLAELRRANRQSVVSVSAAPSRSAVTTSRSSVDSSVPRRELQTIS